MSNHADRNHDFISSLVSIESAFCIGIGDRYHYNVDSGSLKKIAERTGGRAYFPRSERDLRDAFDQIQRELRSQYLVAYSPSNKSRDGTYRRVVIEITNPDLRRENPRLTYRPGYFAKARRIRQRLPGS